MGRFASKLSCGKCVLSYCFLWQLWYKRHTRWHSVHHLGKKDSAASSIISKLMYRMSAFILYLYSTTFHSILFNSTIFNSTLVYSILLYWGSIVMTMLFKPRAITAAFLPSRQFSGGVFRCQKAPLRSAPIHSIVFCWKLVLSRVLDLAGSLPPFCFVPCLQGCGYVHICVCYLPGCVC